MEENHSPDTTFDTADDSQDRTLKVQLSVGTGVEAVVDSKFRIIGELGSGADSTVYLAEHLYLQKKVSLKLFKPVDFESNRFARIQREAVTLANIEHPNIVGVTDLGLMASGEPYIVQEYVEGRDLQSLIKEKGALDEKRALKLFYEISSGISFLHDRGIIHRDIKPSNIIITKTASGEESAKLIDLGIAKPDNPGGALNFYTTSGSIFGSPYYMSPEQCKGEEIDYKSDLYSFGCLMYEVVAGVPPFRGQTMLVTMEKHVHDEAAPINSKRQGEPVSKDLQELISKCLRKNPGERYKDSKALTQALQGLRTSSKGWKKVAVLTIAAVAVVFLASLLIKPKGTNSTFSKKKVDTVKLVDRISSAHVLNWTATTDEQIVEAHREAYEEAVRQSLPPLTRAQLGYELIYSYQLADNYPALRAFFNEMQGTLIEVDQKFSKDRESFRGKSIDCMHRIYYFAGDAFMREGRSSYPKAEDCFKRALVYAVASDKDRVFATNSTSLIKSALGQLYFNQGRLADADKILTEASENILRSPQRNNRVLLNNYVMLTQIKIQMDDLSAARDMLKVASEFQRKTNVRSMRSTIKALEEELERRSGGGGAKGGSK